MASPRLAARVDVQQSTLDAAIGIDEEGKSCSMSLRDYYTPNVFSNVLFGFQVAIIVLYATCTELDMSIAAPAQGASGELPGSEYAMFQDTHIMMLIGFGFLYTLLHRYSWSGVALNYIITIITILWGILTQGFWTDVSMYRRGVASYFAPIPLNIAALINADYTAATVLISYGAVIGRVSPTQLVVMALLEVIFSTANVIIGAYELGINDPGGSMLIHVFGAAFGLAVAYMIGDKSKHANPKTSLINGTFAMIGTLFLFAFWPSFNAALLTGPGQHRAVVNTVLAICCSALTAFLLSRGIHSGKHLDMEHIQNSTLAGGVAIGAACNMLLHPWGAMLLGTVSGAVSAYGFTFFIPFFANLGIRDFCGIMDLHLIPGLIGGVASAIAAASLPLSTAASDTIAPRFTQGSLEENFPMWGSRTGMQQGALQLAQTAISLGFGILSGLLVGWIMTWNVFEPKTGFFYKDDADWAIELDRVIASRVAASRVAGSSTSPQGPVALSVAFPSALDLSAISYPPPPPAAPPRGAAVRGGMGNAGSNGDLKSAAKGSSVGLESTPELQPVSPGTHHANPTAAASAAKPASQTGSVEPVVWSPLDTAAASGDLE